MYNIHYILNDVQKFNWEDIDIVKINLHEN